MSFGFKCFSDMLVRRETFLLLLSTISFCFVTGCSPQPVAREFRKAKTDFGPMRTDGDLEFGEVSVNKLPTASTFKWAGTIETSRWYRVAEDLGWLSRRVGTPEISLLSIKMREAVLAASIPWAHTVSTSPYLSAAIGETRSDSEKAIQEGVDMLAAQEPIIRQLLAARNARTEWPKDPVSLVDLVGRIERFLVEFITDVEGSQANEQVRKQLVEELRINFGPKIGRIRTKIALAYNEPKVYDFVKIVREVLKNEGVNLGPELDKQLDLAERLPRDAERINSAKRALAVLIDFWMAASPETRVTGFKPVSQELYDFFSDQSEADLICLRNGCGIITAIKRELFILPQLEEFGIRKLRTKLVEAAQASIRGELESQATAFLPTLHEEVANEIVNELRRQSTSLTQISKDYGAYLKIAFGRMAVAKLGLRDATKFNGVEPNKIRVNFDVENGGISAVADPTGDSNSRFVTGAAPIGSGLSVAVDHIENHLESFLSSQDLNPIRLQQAFARTLFEQLNKVLLIGGFKTEAEKPFESLAIAIDRGLSSRGRFNIRTMSGSPLSFAVPEGISLGTASRPGAVLSSTIQNNISINVGSQADMIRGLSRLAIHLKDWSPSKFDESLGQIILADFVPDLPRESVSIKLFPKDLFYAATIGNAATVIQNAGKKSSSIGLISDAKKIRWASDLGTNEDEVSGASSSNNKRSAVSPAQQETMAVVFDIQNGDRAREANVADVARYLSALTMFLKAIDGVENTQSSVLKERDSNGVSPLDQFAGGREDVKLLIMVIANFLSKEARGIDGLVLPSYLRTNDGVAIGPRGEPRLLEQALVVRALLDASEAISASIYRHEAIDIFSATNSRFYKPELAFYADAPGTEKAPNLESIVAMLVAGESLKPHLPPARQAQWSKLSKPWIGALRDASAKLP